MPQYHYIAKSLKGEEQSGTSEAKNVQQLAKVLRSEGYILVKAEIGEVKIKKSKLKFEISLPFFGGVSLTEKLMFIRNLQVMIASGLPLPKALGTLSVQTKSKNFQKALLEIQAEIIKGNNFSDSLKKHTNIFSELFQNMIKVGEESGTLDEVLEVLTRQLEREHEMKSKIQGALMYPAVIVSAMVGIGVLMLIMVVPQLAKTFEELEVDLPMTTQVVIGVGTFFSEKFYLVILFVLIFVVFLWRISKIKRGKKIIDLVSLKIPIVSPIIKKTNSASTVRTLSSLIASGVPIVRALQIVSGTLGNIYYKEALVDAVEKVRKGGKLSEALKPYKNLYPLIVFQMIEVGEETGETAKVLAKLADFFEEEVGNATKNLTAIIEPILMLIVGGVIGFFAISMVQPMYSMLGAI